MSFPVLLASGDGVISGRADLVVRHGEETWVADYKSRLRNPDENPRVREEYATQLRLYAYMLHEGRGIWPSRAVLIPLDGRPVEVAIDPDSCRAAADDARAVLAGFESIPLDKQPARPSPGACRFCPHAASCGPFAAALSLEWAPDLLACVGSVQAVETSARGGTAIRVAVESGSVAEPDVWLVRITSSAIAEPWAIAVGTRVAALGLAPAGQPGVFRLRELSVLSLRSG